MKRNRNTRFFLCKIVAWAIAILAMAHTSQAQSIPGRWHKVALPQPLGDNTMDFGFIDSLNGISLSDAGVISSTSNGGRNWVIDTNFGSYGYYKVTLNCLDCTAPRHGFFHGQEATLSITPGDYSLRGIPNFNEVNWGAYYTFAEKMYDTVYGFRLVELLDRENQNQYDDSVVIIVTHDGWQSSKEYGSAYVISPDSTNGELHDLQFHIGYIVDSNDVWTAWTKGDQSTIVLHTSNGGIAWDSVGNASALDFFVNATTREVFCMSSDSVVDYAYSGDYGTTWRFDSTFGPHLWRMANPAPGNLWAMIGQSGPGWVSADVEIYPFQDVSGAPNDYSRKIGYSSDNGKTWTIDSTTFINDSLEEMHFLDARHGWIASWSNDSLFMWYYDADANSGVADESANQHSLTVFPNPLSQSTKITFTSQAAGYAEVSIVNMLGVEVARVFSGALGAGEHNFSWTNLTGLPDGVYECLIRMNGQVETLPVALVH